MSKPTKYLRHFWFIFLYLLVVIYTLIFPTTASWFVFYALTLWLLLSFLSTRQSYHLTQTEKNKTDDNTYSFVFTIQNKRRYPFFLSSIKLHLSINELSQMYETSVFFSKEIVSPFYSVTLHRGHHERLSLVIEGVGLFGLWVKHAHLDVPINIDVYPNILKKSERDRLSQFISPYFTQSSRSLDHDYYMNEIRSFQNRDALARIDWKTSLKRRQWMVKEYETEEDPPIDIVFIGFNTAAFEELLSLAYTLTQELKDTQHVTLYLIGLFDNTVALQQSEKSFLTIRPAQNPHDLIALSQSALSHPSKKIIVKSRDIPFSLPLDSRQNLQLIDEDTLLHVKGGHSDRAAFKK